MHPTQAAAFLLQGARQWRQGWRCCWSFTITSWPCVGNWFADTWPVLPCCFYPIARLSLCSQDINIYMIKRLYTGCNPLGMLCQRWHSARHPTRPLERKKEKQPSDWPNKLPNPLNALTPDQWMGVADLCTVITPAYFDALLYCVELTWQSFAMHWGDVTESCVFCGVLRWRDRDLLLCV